MDKIKSVYFILINYLNENVTPVSVMLKIIDKAIIKYLILFVQVKGEEPNPSPQILHLEVSNDLK